MDSAGIPGVFIFGSFSPERCLIPLTGRGGDVGGSRSCRSRAEPSQGELTTTLPTHSSNHPGPGLQSRLRTDWPSAAQHRALGSTMRDYTATPSSGGACMPCCQICVFAFTAFLIIAERTARECLPGTRACELAHERTPKQN